MKVTTNEQKTVLYPHKQLHGRKQIFVDTDTITRENIIEVLNKCLPVHLSNRSDEEYLYNYLRGKQPILDRIKSANADIVNKVVVNRANEIVTFKTANFVGEPIQYVARGSKKSIPRKIERLNSMMMSEGKASKDMELAYWMFTYGVAYRLILNDKAMPIANGDLYDDAPFEIYTLDSRNTFVAKSNNVMQNPVMGVTYVYLDENRVKYTAYTRNATYTLVGTAQRAEEIVSDPIIHNFGYIPIVEYPCNPLRMGAFEIVIDLLDAINLTESNRLDGVEQFIQALMIFKGVDITREDFLKLKDLGAIVLPRAMDGGAAPDIDYLCEQLDQNQTQTLTDSLYQEVLEIVGMPSQSKGNTSDSSNNGAVMLKNGWWGAESRAKETVGMWRSAETNFLKLVLKICRDANTIDLRVSDIDMKFGRSGYEDLLTKTTAFSTLISANCPPVQAFTLSHLTVDPESAALMYEAYQEKEVDELSQNSKTPPVADKMDISE